MMLSREEKLVLQDMFYPEELIEYLIEGKYITFEGLIDALEVELEEAYEDIMELAGVRQERERRE